ncbi:MAG TPA: bifunctional adenosylcobinamide kinase/adenosylcobinamide-phosphate guanylyltransferase, partial [Thermoleophilia bacterium]|nr:bifunctional adenosylcobinamide kinase/adenosylcobinamide-phosphate guanylyltransferase [Thermoleophilia bacterium]
VAAHRAARPAGWTTVESPLNVGAALRAAVATTPHVVLLDCVTFWISNLLFADGELGGTVPEGLGDFSKDFIPAAVEREVGERVDDALADLLAALDETGATLIAVTNEVGLGVVPEYPIARLYRDELGRVNRRLAAAASRVYLLVSGLPLEVTSLAAPWPSAPEPTGPSATAGPPVGGSPTPASSSPSSSPREEKEQEP